MIRCDDACRSRRLGCQHRHPARSIVMPKLQTPPPIASAAEVVIKHLHGTTHSPSTDHGATERKVRIGFTVALVCLAVIGVISYVSVIQLREAAARIEHTREVIGRLESLFSEITHAQNARRGFVVTGDGAFLDPVQDSVRLVATELRHLRELTADNPAQRRRLEGVAEFIDAHRDFSESVVASRRERGFDAARELTATREGERLHGEIRGLIDEMKQAEERLLVERDGRTRRSVALTKGIIVFGSLMAFGFVGLSLVGIQRGFGGRRRAEELLRRSEESLAVTLQSIGDAVLATDMEGRITRMNRVAEVLTGWTQSEAQNRSIGGILRIIDERTRAPIAVPLGDVLVSNRAHRISRQVVLIARDGAERLMAESSAPIRNHSGQAIGVVLVLRDVSAERKAEAELERFFSLSLDFLCISSADGYFKRVSPAVTDILGWTVEEFLSRPFIDMVHPDDREATLREVDRQVIAGKKVLQFENRYLHKDGSWRVLSWRSVPQPGGLMYATARDVTARQLADEEIRRLNDDLCRRTDQLEATNKELEAFSYSVSHDLRAPLRHVQGYVGMLKREAQDGLSEKARRYLAIIEDASREMGELIDDLLTFSRMGRTEMHAAEIDLGELVEETRSDLVLAASDREIRWQIHPLPKVLGDLAMLRQVFANLLGNAVKYTRHRKRAEIEIGCAGEENDRVVIRVRDNGAGFDMKYADKLFGVFQRLHRADEFEGTGIGLANVQRIMLRHGGRVWAEAKPDAGATFYFTLQPAARLTGSSHPLS